MHQSWHKVNLTFDTKKYEEKSYIGNDPNGNLEKQSLMLPVYALINKKSYWSSTPDFRIIQLKNFNIQ